MSPGFRSVHKLNTFSPTHSTLFPGEVLHYLNEYDETGIFVRVTSRKIGRVHIPFGYVMTTWYHKPYTIVPNEDDVETSTSFLPKQQHEQKSTRRTRSVVTQKESKRNGLEELLVKLHITKDSKEALQKMGRVEEFLGKPLPPHQLDALKVFLENNYFLSNNEPDPFSKGARATPKQQE